MDSIKEKWQEILEFVRKEHELSDVSFKTWLLPLSVYKTEDSTVTILVPNEQLALDYVSKKYTLPIKVAVYEVTGNDVDIAFISNEDIERENEDSDAPSIFEHGMNPRYTFDTFVVGKNNNMAHAASLAVAESPGTIYNPLFLYGGVGLGKTHLMQSIAYYIKEHHPNLKVLYTTSEEQKKPGQRPEILFRPLPQVYL